MLLFILYHLGQQPSFSNTQVCLLLGHSDLPQYGFHCGFLGLID